MERKVRQKGQALLEILIALVIGIIVATAFVTLGVVSVRNSRFSTNQTTATKLAQEGMEAIVTIRDQNTSGAVIGIGGNQRWADLYNPPSLTCSPPDDPTVSCLLTDFILQEAPCTPGGLPTPTPQRCIEKNASPPVLNRPNDIFKRKIRITETGVAGEETEIKNVTVFVYWTDPTGLHKSVLSRKINKQRLE